MERNPDRMFQRVARWAKRSVGRHVALCTLAFLATAALGYAQGNATKTGAANPNPYAGNNEAAAEGQDIYNRVCTDCHGHDGAGGERAPALAANARRYLRTTDRELFDAIESGIPNTMMPPSGLSAEQAWKVTTFIRGLRSSAIDMPEKGNVAHGEEVFWGKGGCGACHMIRGKGGISAPDLSTVANRRKIGSIKDALTKAQHKVATDGGHHDSSLEASATYQQVRIVTRDGQTVTGLLKNEDSFSLQVLASDNTLRSFDRAALRDVQYQPKSAMPTDYDKRLTPDEFQDLMAFLSRQGTKTAPAAAGRRPAADE